MSHPIRTAIKASIPVLFCYFPLGVIYGALFVEQGFSWYWAPFFSLFVFAGAQQFLGLSLLVAGESMMMLALSLIPLGIRNIFYGLTMFDRYKKAKPLLKMYWAHGLVDATYSLLTIGPKFEEKDDARYITALTIIIHLYWVLGTIFGACLNTWVQMPPGLEFSLAAFFMATAMESWLKSRDVKPFLIAAFAIAVALLAFPNLFFLTAVGVALVTCLALPTQERSVA